MGRSNRVEVLAGQYIHGAGCASAAKRQRIGERMTREPSKRATILVADDDPMVLRVTALILNRSGYRVLTAEDGEQAMKAFEEAPHTIELVISDVSMPGMRGPQLVRSINSVSPSTATLLMSGTPTVGEDSEGASFPKPFTRSALVAKVRDLLAACDFAKVEREQSAARAQRLRATITPPS
jgi:DNA-binding NtrC family response regulator